MKLIKVAATLILAAALTINSISTVTPKTITVTGNEYVAILGNSITAGYGAGDAARIWPEVAFDRIFGQDRTHGRSVGRAGQCLAIDSCGTEGWPAFTKTWSLDVLTANPRPTTVIVEIGTNDLGHTDAATMENAFSTIVSQANALGIRVIVGTIPPRASSWWTTYWTWGPERNDVNTWIRNTYGANVADFDTALIGSDAYMRPAVDSGDGVHPNKYGHDDMAFAVPLAQVQ